MFKLIKFIFKLVGFLLLILALLPIIALVVMYKGYEAPKADFEAQPAISFEDIAAARMDEFLSDNDAEHFNFSFTKAEANSALKAIYAANNPDFATDNPNASDALKKYAIGIGDNGGLKGVTLNFYEGGMTLEAGVEAGFSGIYYQTTLFIDFTVEIEPLVVNGLAQTEYKLVIKGISIGNLPILWMYDFANWVYGLVTKDDLNTLIQSVVSGFGHFDLNTKSVWVYTEDLLNLLGDENDPNRPMLEALLGFVDDEELLDTTFADGEGGLALALGKMRSTKTQYQLTSQLQDENDVTQMFTGQLTSLLLSSLGGGDTLNYDMHEQAFNQLLDYYVGDQMNMTQELELGTHKYLLSTQPLFAKFQNGKVYFTVILTIEKDGDLTKSFKTDFTLEAVPSVSQDGQDLIFTIGSIGIGDDLAVSADRVQVVLGLIGESELIQGNQIILEDFLGEFAAQGVSVEDILVVNKYLRFELKPTGAYADALNELQNLIDDVLADVLTDPAFEDILDVFESLPENPTAEDLAELLDAVNELDPDNLEALYEALYNELSGIDGFEGLIP